MDTCWRESPIAPQSALPALSAVTTPPPDARAPAPHPTAPPPGTELGPHYAQCFGCGDQQPTGLHLAATVGEGVRVHAAFTVAQAHQGAPGLAHGGVLAAAVDEALGMLLRLLAVPAVTGRLETDFRRPVPVGETLHLETWCTGIDGRKIYGTAEGRLGAVDGPVAVRAAALFVAVPLEHFRRHGTPGTVSVNP